MRKKQVGRFLVTEENNFVKVTHDTKEFNFRIAASDDFITSFFNNLKSEEMVEAYTVAFSAISITTNMMLSDFTFVSDFIKWYESRGEKKEITKEEDDEVLKQEQALYEMGKEECSE